MSDTELVGLPDGDHATHQQTTTLGGVGYAFTFRYSDRTAGWHLDIDEYPTTRLVTGVRLRTGINLLADAPGRGVLHLLGPIGDATRYDFATGTYRIWWEPEGAWTTQP